MHGKTVAFSIFLAWTPLLAQPRPFDTLLYGVSYYHEYMPYERLEEDVRLMESAGINVVRLGESTWTNWEPRDGEFEFDWMERILNRLHKAGIKVILGTPTYSIPPWLYRKHPEILVSHLTEAPPLVVRTQPTYPGSAPGGAYGPRQNMDLTHPVYRYYAERIIRQIVSRFKDHPAVIGYQIDNETHPNPSGAAHMHADFVNYLRRKFKTTATLNRLWGLAYWGQLVNDWDEFPPRAGILNPGYKLEWERFQRQTVTDFLAWQAAIVRQHKRPDQFITHNFVGGVRTDVDQLAIARHLDVAAVNPYHAVQDKLDGAAISLSGDLCRSLKNQNYLVTETNAQTIGWDSRTQFPPYDGQLRLSAFAHFATGANMVAYWHWHSLHYGQETYWKGVLSHDLEPNRVYREVSRIAGELKHLGPRLVDLRKHNHVAILASVDSYHALRFMPFDDRVNYMTVLQQMYRALYRLNVEVDFVFPETPDLGRYKVLVVPPLYVASDELLGRLAAYVKDGGHLVLSFKSGFTNEYSTVRWTRAPGPLREAAGFSYQEFSSLAQPLALKGDPYGAGEHNRVSVWAEMIIPESAQPLAWYDHPFFGKYPALIRNRFGKGTLTYQGTFLSDELQQKVLAEVLALAGLTGPDQQLPPPVRVKHGVNRAGRTLHFYLNFSGQSQSLTYPYREGRELLTDRPLSRGAALTLGPWDLAIVEEH
ncbi:MAG TPA: beta-galactosidase [Bryobacteraceae bacterium]|nr:beta-galactosidase [Bryobacteraceae bacterium]